MHLRSPDACVATRGVGRASHLMHQPLSQMREACALAFKEIADTTFACARAAAYKTAAWHT